MDINNITDKSIKLFLDTYHCLRRQNILLYSIDFNLIRFNCQRVYNYNYPKFNKLLNFLISWKCEKFGPLLGRDLIENGFNDLTTIFDEIGDRVTDSNNNPLNVYFIKENDILNLGLLASVILRVEIGHSLLPFIKNNTRYRFFEEGQKVQNFERSLNGYLDFLRFGKQLELNIPFIKVHIQDYILNEFYPETIIYINGHPYIKFQQSNMVTPYKDIRTKPIYRIHDTCTNSGEYELEDYSDLSHSIRKFPSMQEMMEDIFALPHNFEYNKNVILNEVNNIFHLDTDNVNVYYDWVKDSYSLNFETEDLLYEDVHITHAKETLFCKYTSLETLIATLKSGKMRLNSIVSMNDPTETEKMKNEGCNFQFYKETEEDVKKNSNHYFVTSLTTKQDDLDMWRFYGNDATGVCLIFRASDDNTKDIFDINYVDFNSEMFSRIDTLLTNLKNKNVRFSILSYVFKHLLMKPKDFKTEDEKRLIVMTTQPDGFTTYSNNIITPYIEKRLKNNIKKKSKNTLIAKASGEFFPLILTKILLGPEMPNKDINRGQIEFMISNLIEGDRRIDVEISSISCYRK